MKRNIIEEMNNIYTSNEVLNFFLINRGNDNSFLKSLLKPEIKYICKFQLKEIIHKYIRPTKYRQQYLQQFRQ